MGFSHLIKDYPSLTTKKDWVDFFNSKGSLLGGTLIPSQKVNKVNDKTIEKTWLQLPSNEQYEKDQHMNIQINKGNKSGGAKP